MKPLISVIVPVYKVEPYLRKCVDSILNQTYTNLEVILVDDGSPDNCGAICDEYARKDSRVRVIHKENGGLSDARNVGMQASRGDYLSFVDSDDMLPENAIETLCGIAEENEADLVIGGHRRFEIDPCKKTLDAAEVRLMTKMEAMRDSLQNGCASWARLYRRELHLPILFPVGEINEDEAIVLRLLDACDCVAVTEQVVYHYRCRPESITTVAFSPRKMDWYWHCVVNHEWVGNHYPELLPFSWDRLASCVVFLLHEMALSDYSDNQIAGMLRKDLRKNYRVYRKYYRSGRNEQIRMWVLNYLPYSLYNKLIKWKRGYHK